MDITSPETGNGKGPIRLSTDLDCLTPEHQHLQTFLVVIVLSFIRFRFKGKYYLIINTMLLGNNNNFTLRHVAISKIFI
jgi:hypothetical protein